MSDSPLGILPLGHTPRTSRAAGVNVTELPSTGIGVVRYSPTEIFIIISSTPVDGVIEFATEPQDFWEIACYSPSQTYCPHLLRGYEISASPHHSYGKLAFVSYKLRVCTPNSIFFLYFGCGKGRECVMHHNGRTIKCAPCVRLPHRLALLALSPFGMNYVVGPTH